MFLFHKCAEDGAAQLNILKLWLYVFVHLQSVYYTFIDKISIPSFLLAFYFLPSTLTVTLPQFRVCTLKYTL